MFSELTAEPVMSEVELRKALAQYKETFYPDPIRMPDLDEIEACARWMATNSNGQFFAFHFARVLMDEDPDTMQHFRRTFERMRASARLYVQIWHYDRSMQSMTIESIYKALLSIELYHREGSNFGGLFWAEGMVPNW